MSNTSGIVAPKLELIMNRQLCHFFRADIKLGMAIAKEIGLDVEKVLVTAPVHA